MSALESDGMSSTHPPVDNVALQRMLQRISKVTACHCGGQCRQCLGWVFVRDSEITGLALDNALIARRVARLRRKSYVAADILLDKLSSLHVELQLCEFQSSSLKDS